MKFENSDTLKYLINAFGGESQSRNRYTFYAKAAKNENLSYISDIFLETAENEREHAKLFYKHIPNGHHIVNSTYPFFFGNTYENLLASAEVEKEEWEIIYKNAAQISKEEGFDEISALFNYILDIEKRHSHRFKELAEQLENESLYKKSEVTQWICTKCGHTHIGKEAPQKCPVCMHEQGYFKLFCSNINV